ncbi:phage holin family protein [Patescibacteria group bacterium]|nr:phage holin family protein [Patescibacteria group bacterium]
MRKLISQILAGILGLWLAVSFVPKINIKILPNSNFFGFPLATNWHIIILLGVILGIINVFLKPILKTITLPLRIITLGFFNLVINLILIWAVDLIFEEITIPWFLPLFWTTLIIWALGIIFAILLKKKEGEL